MNAKNIVVLTGAGISQESGLATFRGANGLWEGHRIEEVATPQAFSKNPELVHRFYNERRRQLLQPEIRPNAAHLALAKFEREWNRGNFLLVTQNIDNLHQRAGSQNMVLMHGQLLKARCVDTQETFDWFGNLDVDTPHPKNPQMLGRLRPDIVWFGEMPIGMEIVEQHLADCDLFVAIGTSGVVYPAAGFVQLVPSGCRSIEINIEQGPASHLFFDTIRGLATVEVPRFLNRLVSAW